MIWTKDQVGRVLEFDYDDAGRRLHERVTTSGGFDTAILRISTTYDTWGRVQLVTSWDNATAGSGTAKNEVKYAYDDWGNVSSFKQDRNGAVSGGGDEYTVAYTYAKKATGDGRYTIRRTQMTLPNGNVVKYTYQSSNGFLDDDASRVTRIRDGSDTNIVRYRYLGSGHVVGVLYNQPDIEGNAYNGSDVYDALDRFNRLIISPRIRWVKNPSTDRYKVTLSYDRNSNITDVDDSVQTGLDWQYTYDDLDRLTRARAGTLSGGSITSETRDQNWTLDHAGNWGNTTFDLNADDVYTGGGEYDWDFTQNKANEITGWDNQSNNVAPVYDAAGNMTDDQRDWQYEYDAWYRLVRVRAQNGSGGDIVAEFKYNGLGHRISARYNETAPWYHFAYDERWRMVAMYEDDAATDVPTEQFWHHNAGPSGFGGSSYIDDVVLRDRATGGGDEGTLDERRYYLQNWHHDVVALVDTSGGIVERANYDGYGMPIGTFTSGGNGNRRGYAGYEIDPELAGHWHVRHRVLRSDLGVWTRRDPLGYVDGGNMYGFSLGSPMVYVDAYGLQSAPPRVVPRYRVPFQRPGHRYDRPGGPSISPPRDWWLDQPPVRDWEDWGIVPPRGPQQIPAWNVPGAPPATPRYMPTGTESWPPFNPDYVPSPEAFPQPGSPLYESLPYRRPRVDPSQLHPICHTLEEEYRKKCHGPEKTSCGKLFVPVHVLDPNLCDEFLRRSTLSSRCCVLHRQRLQYGCVFDQVHIDNMLAMCANAAECKLRYDFCIENIVSPGTLGPFIVTPDPRQFAGPADSVGL